MYIKALSTALLLLELASVTTAAPYLEKRTFKVERVRNEGYTGRNGPRALAKVYRKYGMPLPDGLVNALEAQDKKEALPFQPTKRRTSKWQNPMEGVVEDEDVGAEDVDAEDVDAEDAGAEDVQATESVGEILGDLFGNGNGNGNGNAAGNGANNEGGNRAGKGAGNAAGNGANNNDGKGAGKAGKGSNNNGNNNNGNFNNGNANNGNANNGNANNGNANNGNANNGNKNGNNGNNSTGDPNDDVVAALARAREGNLTGIVQTIPEKNDVEYLSQVKIGGQPVTLDFDTGSSDLWVFNTQLPAEQTQGRQVYDPSKSKTFNLIKGAQFTIRYGDGSGAEGNVGTDVVDVGGAVAPQQAVEMATAVTDTFVKDANNGGLMGLAFGSINAVKPQKQKTFFENVMPSLQEPLFTADLRAGAAGAYEFGRVDTSKFTGQMAWIPVNTTKGFWQFTSEKFAVNGGPAQKATAGGQAIADTGTTLLLADPAIVEGYYAQVPQAQNSQQMGGFVVPCNAKLPDLDLDIGGAYMARIKGADINFAPVGNGGKSQSVSLISVLVDRQWSSVLCGSQNPGCVGRFFG